MSGPPAPPPDPRRVLQIALMVAAWSRRHPRIGEVEATVWDARFEDDDLVVELSDKRVFVVTMTERPG